MLDYGHLVCLGLLFLDNGDLGGLRHGVGQDWFLLSLLLLGRSLDLLGCVVEGCLVFFLEASSGQHGFRFETFYICKLVVFIYLFRMLHLIGLFEDARVLIDLLNVGVHHCLVLFELSVIFVTIVLISQIFLELLTAE